MSLLSLKTQHLIITSTVAKHTLANQTHVLISYQGEANQFWITAGTDAEFKAAHKATLYMLKDRNLNGDKSIAIHDLLIDQELDEHDRDLTYVMDDKILKVNVW